MDVWLRLKPSPLGIDGKRSEVQGAMNTIQGVDAFRGDQREISVFPLTFLIMDDPIFSPFFS